MKMLKIKNLLALAILANPLVFAEANICLTDFQEKLPENSLDVYVSKYLPVSKAPRHFLH